MHASNERARALYEAAAFEPVRELPEIGFTIMRKSLR